MGSQSNPANGNRGKATKFLQQNFSIFQ